MQTAQHALSQDVAVHHRTAKVDGLDVFYREAGPREAPAILLLHGFPTSSHMFRNLMPMLADDYHLVAPDLIGFGRSSQPDRAAFAYTFDHLADVVDRFTEVIGLDRYGIYVFDYGAPVGFRLATAHPKRITSIISQNGNAYVEGLLPSWDPIKTYWRDPTPANREALRVLLQADTTRAIYAHGVSDPTLIDPDAPAHDQAMLDRPGNADIQLDLFGQYQTNVVLYPAWQEYLRTHQPPLLAVWGRTDPFFSAAGAEAYRRDLPEAEIHLLETGHFALETHAPQIAALMRDFMHRVVEGNPAVYGGDYEER